MVKIAWHTNKVLGEVNGANSDQVIKFGFHKKLNYSGIRHANCLKFSFLPESFALYVRSDILKIQEDVIPYI